MEAMLRRKTKEALEEDEINSVLFIYLYDWMLTLVWLQVMRLLEEIKDEQNQFDLDKLCKIMTEEEKQEEKKLIKVSKSLTIVARLRFN